MKILLLVLFYFPIICVAQSDTIYFNGLNQKSRKDKATYFRLPVIAEGAKYKVADYYMNGQLMSEGYSRTADTLIWDGPFRSYYSNGRKFEEGNFVNGHQVSTWKTYYEDTNRLWVVSTYNLLSDTVHILRSFYKSGKIKRIEYNVKNKPASGTCFSEAGEQMPFTPYREAPSFKSDINRFLGTNIRYPDEARELSLDGKVQVVFVVTENGGVENVRFLSTMVHPSLCEEAVRVIKLSSGQWNPARLDDIPYSAIHSHPVNFRLE